MMKIIMMLLMMTTTNYTLCFVDSEYGTFRLKIILFEETEKRFGIRV